MDTIEILEIDEDIKKTKKKKKRKLRKWEKLFLCVNILAILAIIGIYAYRTVYYYKLTHTVVVNPTMYEKLTNLSNLAYQDDGLYEKGEGYFYYKGVEVDNYVFYSGRLFRIIDISDGIRMIEENNSINLVWGVDTGYSESRVHEFLNDYLDTLKDYEVYLQESNWCNETIDVENYKCSEVVNEYVGLLSTQDYLQAGGKNSFLNNHTYYWTINQDSEKKALYINSEGGINNIVSSEDNYYSYGVRAVITLKKELTIFKGDGTKDNPYIIEELGSAMLKDNTVGNYVKYAGRMFQIINIDEEGITLIYDGVLEEEKTYSEIMSYLNDSFIKEFNENDLVKMTNSTNEYNYENKYDYQEYSGEETSYVIIPKIGDLFVNNYENYWLNTVADSTLGLYYSLDENKMFFGDLKSNKHFVRPIIKLNTDTIINSGTGTYGDPLIVGDVNEEN